MGEPSMAIPIPNAGDEVRPGSTSTTKKVFSLLKRLSVGRLIQGSASIAKGVAGSVKEILARYGQVKCSCSPQPTGDLNDQVGTDTQNIIQVSNGVPAQAISPSEQEKEKEKLYVPQKFALGPFYQKPASDESEKFKDALITERDKGSHFEALVENMRADVSDVRTWYVRTCELHSLLINEGGQRRKMGSYREDDLARMMARDGLFLLEFLRYLTSSTSNASHFTRRPSEISTSPSGPADDLFRTLEQRYPVQEDVMRIVNQIPFFVLKRILQWEAVPDKDKDKDEANNEVANTDQVLETLLKKASHKLSPIDYDNDSRVPGMNSHLLEFVYENIISSSDIKSPYKWRRKSKSSVRVTLPRAVQLTDKGVKFAPNDTGLLSEIRFDSRKRKLYLPVIEMDGKTEALLTNMVRFEGSKQGQRQASQPLISYVDLMDRLIDNDKDVEALRERGIIQCHLATNSEVADVWNGMRKLLPDSKMFKYEPIDYAINDVIRFYKSKCRSILTQIHRRYFSNPWSGISLAAAFILLVLTVFQTYLAWEQVRLQRISMHKP